VLRDPRAVRDAVEIHLRVAEGSAHIVQIAHGDARRVIARVAGQRRAALAQQRLQLLRIEHGEFGIVRQRAIEPIRAASAALIDQHEVAVAPDARERRGGAQIEIAGGLSGTAAQNEERIRCWLQAQRRDDGDMQRDFFALGARRHFPAVIIPVLAHAVPAAACSDAAAGRSAFQPAVFEPLRRRVGGSSTNCAAKYPCY
jgi:hypothetical protein